MHFIGPDQHHGFEQRLTTDVYPADLDMVPDWRRDPADRLQWYHDADTVYTAGVSQATVQQDFDDEVGFRTLRHLNDRVRANRGAGEDIPFFMVTSFIHPHDPYEPPREHWDRFADVEIPAPEHPEVPDAAQDPHTHRLRAMSGFDQRETTAEEVARARRSYYAAVSYIDDHVGRIRERLGSLGLLEKTVIVVTSDHGDMLGEKGLRYKMSHYEESARVPLILHGPEHLIARGRFATPVSLLDLRPTLLELAGAPEEVPTPVPAGTAGGVQRAEAPRGLSLLESARREASGAAGPEDRDILIEYLAEGTLRPQVTLVRGQYKYVICPGDPDQLFDLDNDPRELRNVAAAAEHADLVGSLREELTAQYGLETLEEDILASQARRRLVAQALQQGQVRHWDYEPDPEQRYVRGDFWSALAFGQIRDVEPIEQEQ